MLKKSFSVLILFFFVTSVFSQNQNDGSAKREYRDNAYWLTLRADYYLKSKSFLFFETNSTFSKEYGRLSNNFPFSKINEIYFLGGYEHKASEHWYLGLSEKVNVEPWVTSFWTRANISHRGKISSLRFIKEAAMEYLKYPQPKSPNALDPSYGQFSMNASLIKDFKIAGKKMFVLFSYRPYLKFELKNSGLNTYSKRFFDQTKLRVEVDYFLTKNILIGLFAIRDTEYYYISTATYDQNGNILTRPGKVNSIIPTFGLSLNYVINAPEDFIPGFPIK